MVGWLVGWLALPVNAGSAFTKDENKMNKELIEKYYKNNCTTEELKTVLAWFENSAWTTDGKSFLFDMWEQMADDDQQPVTGLDPILHRIHHQVNLMKTEKVIISEQQEVKEIKGTGYFINVFSRAAAVLMIPILCYGLYISHKYEKIINEQTQASQHFYELKSSYDAITKVALPDGSLVWLNYGSILKYPAIFSGQKRVVELIGEGYFEVAHNPEKPFIVKVGEIEVIARGTEFNITGYPDDNLVETSLINGKVEIGRLLPEGKTAMLFAMKPNDMAVYFKANGVVKNFIVTDDRNYSWKEGKVKFIKDPIEKVTKTLGRRFNADFFIKDQKSKELTFSATFDKESLPEIMKLMSIATPMKYTITEPKKLADGSYSKRKVSISYRRD